MQRNKAILPSFILCLPFLLSPVHLHNLIYFQPMPVSTLALSYTPWLFFFLSQTKLSRPLEVQKQRKHMETAAIQLHVMQSQQFLACIDCL